MYNETIFQPEKMCFKDIAILNTDISTYLPLYCEQEEEDEAESRKLAEEIREQQEKEEERRKQREDKK